MTQHTALQCRCDVMREPNLPLHKSNIYGRIVQRKIDPCKLRHGMQLGARLDARL